jgi:DNA gyrase subunit A
MRLPMYVQAALSRFLWMRGQLNWVKMTHGASGFDSGQRAGRGIRFCEEDVRPMGRTAAGFMPCAWMTWDNVAGADVASAGR